MEGKVISISDRISKNGWDSVDVATDITKGNYLIGKTEENKPVPFKVGDVIDHTVEESNYGTKLKLHKKPVNGFGGGVKKEYKAEPFEHKAAGYAAAYSKDLAVAGKIDLSEMAAYADKFYSWMVAKKQA
jgi:hypothetical protein